MKGLAYVIGGSLAVGAVGCSEYKGVGGYSCESNSGQITARNGERYAKRYAKFYEGSYELVLTYSKNLSLEEAVKAVRACREAFGKKTE